MDFEDIRPYNNEELPVVLDQLAAEPAMAEMISRYFPQMPLEPFLDRLRKLNTIKQFQGEIIANIVDLIITETADGLSHDGLENLSKDEAYLFISNHRDIVLDSALINYILNKSGFETARIAIGINLLVKPWITHLVKLNKSFVVKRDLPRNEMYAASMQLSTYIKKSITKDHESVWIAQREGRSKDGNDRTHSGLLNMLGMSREEEGLAAHFEKLNIIPVSISYELDPCDALKLPELYAACNKQPYTKKPDEDYISMRTGITGQNGHIHISFGQPVRNIPEVSDTFKKGDVINYLVEEVDRQVHRNYRLWPSSYIAADLLSGQEEFGSHYSVTEKENFKKRMETAVAAVAGDPEVLWELFLKIYANPLFNRISEQD